MAEPQSFIETKPLEEVRTASERESVEGATSKAFRHFYQELVEVLPMNDSTFIAQLFSVNLLPGDVKALVDSKPTSASKATCFLDHIIKPSLTSGIGTSFDNLIKVMENSEYDGVKEIAKLIRCTLRKRTVNHKTDVYSTTNKRSIVMFNPINADKLRARYLRQLPIAITGWPKHRVIQYVRLALVKNEDVTRNDKRLNKITRLTLQGEVDNILKNKEPLNELREIFHYQNIPCPRLILIIGAPGIGKTTLANEICVKWAKDQFLAEDFDIVILIPLRLVQQRSIEKVMLEHTGKNMYKQVKMSAGRRCLVILEGLDEMALERRESDPFLVRVVKECTLLEEATIMITSRPHACEELDVDRTVEVVGFGKKEIQEFVEKSFPDDINCVKEFSQQLNDFPHLESLSYVPMNLVMIVDIFKSEKKLPSTITQLYRQFIESTLHRQVKKNKGKQVYLTSTANSVDEKLCQVLTRVPKEAERTLSLLCRLAFCSFFNWYSYREDKCKHGYETKCKNPKIIFTVANLKECGIEATDDWDGYGLLKATHIHELPTDTTSYNFSHLTIQEFLCAVYISTLPQEVQKYLLSEQYSYCPNVFIFLFGLARFASHEMFHIVFCKLLERDTVNAITAVRCLYECQSTISCQPTMPICLALNDYLLPYDCLCISYVLSCYPVSQLMILDCYIGDKGAKLLVKHYPGKNSTGQLLQVLDIRGNGLTIDGFKHIMKIVKTSSTSLEYLFGNNNPIGDDAISLLTSELQHNNSLIELSIGRSGLSLKGAIGISEMLGKYSPSVLTISESQDLGDDGITAIARALCNSQINVLNINSCDITCTGARSLADGLIDNKSVRSLNLSSNRINDDGITAVAKALCSSQISTLDVHNCGITYTGVRSIAQLLVNSNSLHILDVAYNNIGDDGITAIAETLSKSQINELNVGSCEITVTGARSLARELLINKSIKILEIYENPITVEGARLILKSAVDNGVCHKVSFHFEMFGMIFYDDDDNNNYQLDDEIKKMMMILEQRKIQECSHARFVNDSSSSRSSSDEYDDSSNSDEDELVREKDTIN